MSDRSRENDEIECFLKQTKLPEPSADLRERVTSAARKAWDKAAPDIPWQVPIRRLAVAAAAAMLMVSVAGYYGDLALAGQQSHELAAAAEETPDLGDGSQVLYSPLVRHLTMTHKSSVLNSATLLKYVEKVREILDEGDPGEAPDALPPTEHRSHLLPTQLNFYS